MRRLPAGYALAVDVRIGTSGWVYRDWKQHVYPPGLPQGRWLEHIAERFPTVELNASFYRLPPRSTFERWRERVPPGFVFAAKMSRYFTHIRRLRDPHEPITRFWEAATGLGPALGPVLFQFPPRFPRELRLLEDTLAMLPTGMRAAFEFRDPSWETDDVLAALDDVGAAWVLADRPGARVRSHVTGGWSYVRFHRGTADAFAYPPAKLRRWADRIARLPVGDVFCYFNNDPGGAAVRDAETLEDLLGSLVSVIRR
ncbi:MAG TPA: DUF72 domain-containing protein [Actinomycetota bacterium]|nr:DUF72 domain-containing protein [Actinomycetota bacterium]